MGFYKWLHDALAGPPHVDDSDRNEGPEIDAAMAADFSAANKGEADAVKGMERGTLGGALPGKAGSEAAEAAEDDLQSEEPPSAL
jgi:hypothetical protein